MILFRKILGSTVLWLWTALFAAPFVVGTLAKVLPAETIEQLRSLGDPNGPMANYFFLALMSIAPLVTAWYAKMIEVAKRWIAAHMPSSSLPEAAQMAKDVGVGFMNPITSYKVATGINYPRAEVGDTTTVADKVEDTKP